MPGITQKCFNPVLDTKKEQVPKSKCTIRRTTEVETIRGPLPYYLEIRLNKTQKKDYTSITPLKLNNLKQTFGVKSWGKTDGLVESGI